MKAISGGRGGGEPRKEVSAGIRGKDFNEVG